MRFAIAITALIFVAASAAPCAAALSDAPRGSSPPRAEGPASVFADPVFGTVDPRLRPRETLRLDGERVGGPGVFRAAGSRSLSPGAGGSRLSGRKAALAIVSSALLPGLGELVLYTDSRDPWTLARVPVFFALEGYFWYGYRHNYNVGKDYKRQYEEYGDLHWDLDRFLLQHPCCDGLGGCDTWQEYNETCQGEFNYFLFTPKEEDREEYYENMGKYNAFVYGWDDWAGQSDYWTPHRRHYWSLRGESDAYLLRSDQFVMALILNRVASMVDTGWLAYRMSRGGGEDGWSLRVRTFDTAPCLVISRGF